MTRGIYTVDLAGARSHGTERRQRVSSSSRRGREDAPRPVQTSVPTATDMFEQIVQDKPACFGNEPLSLSFSLSVYVPFRACTFRMCTYEYVCISCAPATYTRAR